MTTKHTPATSNRLFTAQEMFAAVAADPRVKAYRKLVEALRHCVKGMPHNPPQDDAVALLKELGEWTS